MTTQAKLSNRAKVDQIMNSGHSLKFRLNAVACFDRGCDRGQLTCFF